MVPVAVPVNPPAIPPETTTYEATAPSSVAEEDFFSDLIEDIAGYNKKELLEVKKFYDFNDSNEMKAMIEAIEKDRAYVAELILEEGLDADSRVPEAVFKESLLHWTAIYDAPNCAKANFASSYSKIRRCSRF